jgi:glutathione S-transferase
MTVKLYQFPTSLGVPNLSPFCMKVEVYLRLAGIDYEIKWTPLPMKGPLGKLPFIEDDGKRTPDSSSIIDYLDQKYDVKLDAHLSAEQRAQAHVLDRMLGEHTYFALLYCRWIDPGVWPVTRKAFFGAIPPGVRGAVARLAQRGTKARLKGHGLGLHAPQEIYRRVAQDLDALAAILGEQRYVLGDRPSRIDATVYAFLANMWEVQIDSPLKPLVARHRNLVAYCERMRERCFDSSKRKR